MTLIDTKLNENAASTKKIRPFALRYREEVYMFSYKLFTVFSNGVGNGRKNQVIDEIIGREVAISSKARYAN